VQDSKDIKCQDSIGITLNLNKEKNQNIKTLENRDINSVEAFKIQAIKSMRHLQITILTPMSNCDQINFQVEKNLSLAILVEFYFLYRRTVSEIRFLNNKIKITVCNLQFMICNLYSKRHLNHIIIWLMTSYMGIRSH
jgi:hypothetical protein